MDNLNTFLDLYGLAAIFGIMLVKSAGVPIPIPADVLMLATSARVATGKMALVQAFMALLIALVIGGIVQFGLVRGLGRGILYRYGRYLGLTPARLDTAAYRLKNGGPLSISLSILTPGVRSIAVIACGLAGISFRRFILGLALGSGLFLALHFFLGYVGGSLLNSLGTVISVPALVIGIIGAVIVGLGIWVLIRRRQMPDASNQEVIAQAIGSWHEATCPVCLALGAANRLQIHLPIEHIHPIAGHVHEDR